MRDGFSAKVENLRTALRSAEQFLGRFAADCLISQARALDRIARDLRFVDSPPSHDRRLAGK